MERLTIQAANLESGRAILAALSMFRAELLEGAGGCEVVVTLSGDNAEIVAVLNALERYVNARGDGPARLELDGHAYVMEPEREIE
jgi:hypothetical protein